MTAILFAIGAGLLGLVAGLRLRHRRFLAERQRRREAERRNAMYDTQALRTDLDVVGPVTPPSNVVHLFDQDQLAELREQAESQRDIYSFLGDGQPAPRCADGGPCAYTARGMASCDDRCAVSLADDEEARQFLADIRERDHLGQPCGWSDDGTTACGDPAVTWGFHANGDRVWLCTGHERCATPRSLPDGRGWG